MDETKLKKEFANLHTKFDTLQLGLRTWLATMVLALIVGGFLGHAL